MAKQGLRTDVPASKDIRALIAEEQRRRRRNAIALAEAARSGDTETFFLLAYRGPLFDHVVGHSEHARRDFETQRLRGLEVDVEPVPRWLLDRQIGRFLTA